jgi:tetratricopeptide (TPR) repeat protein
VRRRISRRRIQTRTLVVIGCSAGIAAAAGAILLLSGSSGTGVPKWLTVLGALLASVVALTGIAGSFSSMRAQWLGSPRNRELLAPVLVGSDAFVDRVGELEQISSALVSSRCISCHGQRGTGKSHLLGYIADVVNGNRQSEPGHRMPSGFAASFYFDLADAAGFEQFVTQACRSTFPEASSWTQFVNQVDRRFRRGRVVLILDNVNLGSLWTAVGKAVYEYLARRPADAALIGSIDPVIFHNLVPEYVPVRSFDIDAVRSLTRLSRPDLDQDAIVELYQRSGGLPMYLRLLLANSDDPGSDEHVEALAAFLEHTILPNLESQVRHLVATVGVLGHVSRTVSLSRLRRLPLVDLERNLARAESRSLITVNAAGPVPFVRIHDLVRDTILRLLPDETNAAVADLVTFFDGEGMDIEASIVSLFGDPHRLDVDVEELLERVVDHAVALRNYPFLETVWRGCASNERLLRYIHETGSRQALIAYAKASFLAGAGRYADAETELLTVSSVATSGAHLTAARAFDLRFLLADVTHLQNRYDEALDLFHELLRESRDRGDTRRQAKCEWAIGHSLRHQGHDLDEALCVLRSASEQAQSTGDLAVEVLATADASAIEVYFDTVDEGLADRLLSLEGRVIAAGDRPADLVKLWKERARVEWARGFLRAAADLLETAIEEALRLNDRLLYNLYFERAEFARLAGDLERARLDYGRVATFSEGNRDRNMIANSLLGLALCDVVSQVATTVDGRASIRAKALQARQIAATADIQATAAFAEELVVAMDRRKETEVATHRLIVF